MHAAIDQDNVVDWIEGLTMGEPAGKESQLTLKRASGRPTWWAVGWRVGAVIGLIAFMVLYHWIDRNHLYDELDGEISFLDAIYFTMISVTTTGYGDIVPVTDRSRMFDALVVTPARIFLLLIFVGTAYLFVARNSWEKFVMKRIQRALHDHIIVAGFGTKNRRAVEELLRLGTDPKSIVVIDANPERLSIAESCGTNVLKGDATRDETLLAVRLEQAKLLLISAGRDDTSILICLTARDLAPDLKISIAINEKDNEAPARRAGADVVVNPLDFAGLLLATSHTGQHIAAYLADLASGAGKVLMVERLVKPHEIGRGLRDIEGALALRLIRDGKPYGFWRPQAAELQPGDIVMEIRPTV
jgi:voltage-gated potassium channel